MKKMQKIVTLVLIITSLFACKKATDDFVPYNNSDFNDTEWSNSSNAIDNTRSNAMITALSKPALTASFNALSDNSVDLNSNTQLFLPANAYTLNGNNYTGNITASLNSVISKGDFVRNLISSCNTNDLQETVAAFDLNLLSSNKEKLDFKKSNKFSLSYVDSVFGGSLGFDYYYGTNNQGIINWTLADSLKGELNLATVNIMGNSSLAFQISSNELGWMTINRAINLGTTTTCNVLLPLNFTNKNTAVFAVFKNKNIVLRMNGDAASKSFVCNNLPIGSNVTFIALSYLDNQFYLGFNQNIVTSNSQYTIKTPTTPISLSSLNSFLDGL